MDNRQTLRQYFGDSEVPPASQFFDEIGTSPSDMIQSVYLGGSEGNQTTTANLFPQNMSASFTQHKTADEIGYAEAVPTVTGATALPAASLPDPATFFDTIGPEAVRAGGQSGLSGSSGALSGPLSGSAAAAGLSGSAAAAGLSGLSAPTALGDAIDGLAAKNEPVDSEEDRRRDAWIPSEETKKVLDKVQSSPKGAFFPERDCLTMPAVLLEEELPDALQEAGVRLLGVCAAAGGRPVRRAEHAPRDEAGLRALLRAGWLRAAVNHSARLLPPRGARVSARALQVWLARLGALARLRMDREALREAATLAACDRPDMFYQFYPETYGARRGSLAPFALRLLLAELPAHCAAAGGAPGAGVEEALRNLYAMRAVIDQMLRNLASGLTEDGAAPLRDAADRAASLRLWSARRARLARSLVNCAVAARDYRLAAALLARLADAAEDAEERRGLCGALGRLWLLAGHAAAARAAFARARELRELSCPTPDVRELVDAGLAAACAGQYAEAYAQFALAAHQDPTDVTVANNMAVCLLYTGRLRDAIATLQAAGGTGGPGGTAEATGTPGPRALAAAPLLLNLATLLELQSAAHRARKLQLLRALCDQTPDCLPDVLQALKLD